MIRYKSVRQEADAEKTIEKSRFIAHVKPVSSREEAEAFVARIKSTNKDATHNVPAFIIGEKSELQWASDDGEPSGTSGAPMLQMLAKEGLTNIAVVVTRYFGGVKLGTGGLARAYTSVAKLAVDLAGVCEMREIWTAVARLDYTYYGKLQNMAAGGTFNILGTTYDDAVNATIAADLDEAASVRRDIMELTGGSLLLSGEAIILSCK